MHTSGPWTTAPGNDGQIRILSGPGAYAVTVAVLSGPDAEDNARVMAAAPAMLEALRAVISPLAEMSNDELKRHHMMGAITTDALEHVLAARAALAAATGEGT